MYTYRTVRMNTLNRACEPCRKIAYIVLRESKARRVIQHAHQREERSERILITGVLACVYEEAELPVSAQNEANVRLLAGRIRAAVGVVDDPSFQKLPVILRRSGIPASRVSFGLSMVRR